MKKVVAISFAVCLSVSAVVNAQPTANDFKRLEKECISKNNLHSCTTLALYKYSKDRVSQKKYLHLACPANSEQYDPQACGIIGTDYIPSISQKIFVDKPDVNKAIFYLKRACESDIEDKKIACVNLAGAYNERAF